MNLTVFRFKKVKSTNNTAIRIAKKLNHKSGMIVSETQTNGKGQYGKKWISYKGNLFVSFFHELKNINLPVSSLTKINCLIVKKLIENFYKGKIFFKKPNDLLVNKKKISGILQEILIINKQKFLIVGIGLNIVKSPKIKNYPTINLKELTNKLVSKIVIEKKLKHLFEKNLSKMYKFNKR